MGDRFDNYFPVSAWLFYALQEFVKKCEKDGYRGNLILRHDSSDDSWSVLRRDEPEAKWIRIPL